MKYTQSGNSHLSSAAFLLAFAAGIWSANCLLLGLAGLLMVRAFYERMDGRAERDDFRLALRCCLAGMGFMAIGTGFIALALLQPTHLHTSGSYAFVCSYLALIGIWIAGKGWRLSRIVTRQALINCQFR
jgi:hypothetical protein